MGAVSFLAWKRRSKPVARDQLVDLLSEAVIYIDHQLLIGDLNPAAKMLLGSDHEVIGKKAHQVLAKWPYLESRFREKTVSPSELRNIQDRDGRWYDVRISPLTQRSITQGWLLILRVGL